MSAADAPVLPAEGELSPFERAAVDRWAKADYLRIRRGIRWRDFRARRAGLVGGLISHRGGTRGEMTGVSLEIDAIEWSKHVDNRPLVTYVDVLPGGIQFKKAGIRRDGQGNGGGERSAIAGFSKNSQSRLMSLLQRVQFDKFSAAGKGSPAARAFFVTLTYSDAAPTVSCPLVDSSAFCWHRVKRDIDAFGKRLKRLKNFRGMLWKMELEPRKTGARKGQLIPHFHCLLLWHKVQRITFFRRWLSLAWFQVVGSGDPAHFLVGTNAMTAYGGSTGKLFAYLGKYIGKTFKFDGVQCGRVWGIIASTDPETGLALKNPLDLAAAVQYVTDCPERWQVFVRRLQKWGQKSEYLRRLSVFQSAGKIYGNFSEMMELIAGVGLAEYDPPDLRAWSM